MNRARLLLIERDSSLRLMLERQLRRLERLDVEVAEEASVGVNRALLGQFDIVLASLHLPHIPPSYFIESLAAARPQPVLIAIAHPERVKELDEEKLRALWSILHLPLARSTVTDTVVQALQHHQDRLCQSILPHGSCSQRSKLGNRPVRLGHYEISARIGGNAKGIVYRGVDNRTGDEVALRAIPREMIERLGRGTRWLERFTREASSAASVNHPNLAAILDHGFEEDQRCLFVVSEFARGTTLAQQLKKKKRLEPRTALTMAIQTANALSAIHSSGFAHRLVRPTNISLTDDGKVSLTDLGIASMLAWDLMPLRPRLLGTPYLSPEQVRMTRVDDRSDQFSLGLVLYEALSGKHCLSGDSPSAKIHALMTKPIRIELDDQLEERDQFTKILERMLALDPEERYRDDGEIRTVLRRCAEDLRHLGNNLD